MIKVLIISLLIAVAAIQCEDECKPNTCNEGVCSVVKPENSKHLSFASCKCNVGTAGFRCEQVDQCVAKNQCTEGKLCSLDREFKPVCACPLGFHAANCTESK